MRTAQDHRFSLFPVICSQALVTRTPDNSNLFLFPLKVRVIGSRLYIGPYNTALCTNISFPKFFICNTTTLQSLVNLHKKAARIMTFLHFRAHSSLLFHKLRLLKFQDLTEFSWQEKSRLKFRLSVPFHEPTVQ